MTIAERPVQIALKRILVATDFSECSERALRTGLGIAQRYGSHVHMVHVVPSEGYGVAGVGMLGAMNFARHNARDLESELLQKGYLEGIHYRISLERGEVWPGIARIVEEEDTDLVILGTRGRSGVGKLLLGSIAERIFRQAKCPVLTVGPNSQPSFPLSIGPTCVLFPTDFSIQAEHAFPYAVSLAEEHQGRFVLLHVVQRRGEATFNEDRARRYANSRLRDLAASVMGLGTELESLVEDGDPAQVIVKTAADCGAELVVLGVRASAGFSDRLGWSTAYGVVRETPCPVLTVRWTPGD